MNIVIAGIKRSGSTLLYNMVRLVLEAGAMDVLINGQHYTLEDEGVNLVKIHPYREHLARQADHVFLSDRDMYELKESLENFTKEEQPWERLTDMYKHLKMWALHSSPSHYFEYPQLTKDKMGCIKRISTVLGASVDIPKILTQLNNITPPKQGKDPKTLLFHNHKSQ